MSKRRVIGDVVQVQYDKTEPPYLIKLTSGSGVVPDDCVLDCGDLECREWAVAIVLDDIRRPTGEKVYHISECLMSDPDPLNLSAHKPKMPS
ncbi:hypothetical protein GCM10009425_40310 [Pseudomonas asuensis]|uniref:DUF2158 domain-containing protein n=1 Tax=Pseudomonas asuensis TaxID=1825787 RepID=A0ABQ2H2S3_9PSED|nr:hypothetical protein GCM10009425_40310 [Pseudomonas asuensis]